MAVPTSKPFLSSYIIESVDENVATFPMIYGDESVAMAVRIKTGDTYWMGIFRLGGNSRNLAVFTCPDPDELCVLCGQRVSIINISRIGSHAEFVLENITEIVPVEARAILLMATYTDLVAYGHARIIWRSPRLCSDELKILQVDDQGARVTCSGFFAAENASREFSVNLVDSIS